MKKSIAILFTILFLIFSMSISVFAATPASSLSVNSSDIYAGDTITVTVTLSNCTSSALGIIPGFDDSNFEYVTGSGQWLITGGLILDPADDCATALYSNPYSFSGSVYQFKVKAKTTAKPGKYTISCEVQPEGATLMTPSVSVTVNCKTHSYGNWVKYSTTQHKRTCSACGNVEYSNHTWNSGSITKEASCKEKGVKTYTCTACSETKTEDIEKTTTHKYGSFTKDSTTQHKRTCSVCSNIDYENHKWNSGTITKEANCKEKGVRTYTCTVCSETKTEDIEKTTTHKYGSWTKDSTTQHKRICSVCSNVENENHKWNSGTITKEANCKEKGVKTYTCTVCSETKTEDIEKTTTHKYGSWTKDTATQHKRVCSVCSNIENENHSWDSGKVTKDPTCKDKGIKTYTCSVCSETKTEDVSVLTTHKYGDWEKSTDTLHKHTCSICSRVETEAHKWNGGEVTKEPSCKEKGVKTYKCTVCSATKTEDIEKTTTHKYGSWTKDTDTQHKRVCSVCSNVEYENHKWNNGEITKEANCKEKGVKTYTCTVCSATKTEDIEKTTTHKYGDWTKDTDAQHKRVCSVCSNTEKANHTWNSGKITKEATCKDTGVKTFTCTACSAEKTETIEKSAVHSFGSWTTTKSGTCVEKGVQTRTCSVCKINETRDTTFGEHSFGEWTTTKNSTCIEKGTQTRTCSLCKISETKDIAVIDHVYGDWKVTKAATCTAKGIETKTCTGCGKAETREIAATGHSYSSWKTTKEATYTEKGEKTRTCANCGKTETKSIAVIGHEHSYGDWVVTKEPTCMEKGEKTKTCSTCGDTESEEIPETDHAFGEWVITKENNCVEKGEETQTCTICGQTNTREVLFGAHVFDEGTVTKEATCTETGILTKTCSVCGEKVTEEIPLIAHNYDNGEVIKEATASVEGLLKKTCLLCGESTEESIPVNPDNPDIPDDPDVPGDKDQDDDPDKGNTSLSSLVWTIVAIGCILLAVVLFILSRVKKKKY